MMSGFLEQAAGTLNLASEQIPIEHIRAAIEALSATQAATQQVGGQASEQLGRECQAIQNELQGVGERLTALRQNMQNAAQRIAASGGAG